MPAAETQVFRGHSHQLTFRFEAAGERAEHLVVAFADVGPEPDLAHVADLAHVGVHRLYVLDDFGVYADEHGYPGCWYLGEGRRPTFEEDVVRLVDEAARAAGVARSRIVAVGRGKGGWAALYYALRHDWGHVIAGSPHSRLGRLLSRNGLATVAQFIAGGTDRDQLRWLDGVLFDALEHARTVPRIRILANLRDPTYGEQVVPLAGALERREAAFRLDVADLGTEPGQTSAAFSAYLVEALSELTGERSADMPLPRPRAAAKMPWNRRTVPRLDVDDDGLRCFVALTPTDGNGHYAGVRLPVEPFRALTLELSFRRVDHLQTILVDALDGAGERVHRWRWPVEASWRPAPGRQRFVLRPGEEFAAFRADQQGEPEAVRAVDVFVKARSASTIDFTVHRVAVLAGEPPASKPGLPLPAPAHNGARPGRLHTDAELAERVAALVAAGDFPPAVLPPAGPVARPRLKVAGVLDPFSELGFRYEFDLVALRPDDYEAALDRERPDLVLVESAWRGADGAWTKLVADTYGHGASEQLAGLVAACRRRDIPTVFWNKEDPPNFEVFIAAAGLFDHVFTTDEDCIAAYRERTGHDRIGLLPFAAQPRIHNPAGAPRERPLDVAFLGTFYGRKHPDRRRQMEAILDPAREFGVHIYSRVENVKGYEFPLKYRPHLIGTLPYERALGAYHEYKVLLNVNSVVGSRTMCARRVFEILACGGAVVSGPSPAIGHVLGGGVVHECASHGETREALAGLLAGGEWRERGALEGVRRVLAHHTYADRVDVMLRALGHSARPADRSITLVALVQAGPHEELLAAVAAQSHADVGLLLVVPAGSGVDTGGADAALRRAGKRGAAVLESVDADAGGWVMDALRLVRTRYVGFVDARAWYGSNYVGDLVDAFRYVDAGVVGKSAHYRSLPGESLAVVDPDAEHRAVASVLPEAFVAERALFERVPVGGGPWREALRRWQAGLADAGVGVYAADRFNFVADGRFDGGGSLRVEVFGPGARHALA